MHSLLQHSTLRCDSRSLSCWVYWVLKSFYSGIELISHCSRTPLLSLVIRGDLVIRGEFWPAFFAFFSFELSSEVSRYRKVRVRMKR